MKYFMNIQPRTNLLKLSNDLFEYHKKVSNEQLLTQKQEDNLQELLEKAKDVLDKDYSFLLINSYTTGLSPTSLKNILITTFNDSKVETGEIGLPVKENNLVLPCGIYGKVTRD